MKKQIKNFLLWLLVLPIVGLFMGCQSNKEADSSLSDDKADKTIKIGSTSMYRDFYEAMKDDYEAKGYKTEFVTFDSNPVVLEAINSGEVDLGFGQTKLYAEQFNKNKNGDLAMAHPYGMYSGIGLYSEKYDKSEDIPEGGTIAVMNDPMNCNTALRILEEEGLIKLDPEVELATVGDIVENPKNLHIMEMEQAQTVTALDTADASCVWFTHMHFANKDPKKYIARDHILVNQPMGIIAKEGHVEEPYVIDMANIVRSKDFQEKVEKHYPGIFTFYESDDEVDEGK